MTLEITLRPISLRELVHGLMPYVWRVGLTPVKSGPVRAPASHSAQRESAAVQMTFDIFGPNGSASSESAALQSSLVSRLRVRMASTGSTLFVLTWKVRVTPSRRSIYALRGRARRISGSGFTSWPTTRAQDSYERSNWKTIEKANNGEAQLTLTRAAKYQLTSWRSPEGSDGEGGVMEIRPGAAGHYKLRDEVNLTTWPTPNTMDGIDRDGLRPSRVATNRESGYLSEIAPLAEWPTPMANKNTPQQREDFTPNLANVASWATPASRDWRDGSASEETMNGNSRPLNEQVSSWVTPQTGDYRSGMADRYKGNHAQRLNDQLAASGLISNGSPAGTEKPGQLNPAFSLWLMGLPDEWLNYAP